MIKFIFKIKGSTFATEQNNFLISPISNFEILKIEKLSMDPYWGSTTPPPSLPTHDHLCYTQMKKSPAILKTLLCSTEPEYYA